MSRHKKRSCELVSWRRKVRELEEAAEAREPKQTKKDVREWAKRHVISNQLANAIHDSPLTILAINRLGCLAPGRIGDFMRNGEDLTLDEVDALQHRVFPNMSLNWGYGDVSWPRAPMDKKALAELNGTRS